MNLNNHNPNRYKNLYNNANVQKALIIKRKHKNYQNQRGEINKINLSHNLKWNLKENN